MARYTRSARAEEDLLDIWSFIAPEDLDAADRLLDRIDQACALLADMPAMGRARPDLGRDFRYFPVGSYLILYRQRTDAIEIVRVVHGARYLPDVL